MNIVFLDYDGVVNNPLWKFDGNRWKCSYGYPKDKAVNDIQAVQWVSEFCEKFNYSIVVTSTWRKGKHGNDYAKYLINGGLRDTIKIVGRTPDLSLDNDSRIDEINYWLDEHPEVERYIIFDDDEVTNDFHHFVHCQSSAGFREEEYFKAKERHISGETMRYAVTESYDS